MNYKIKITADNREVVKRIADENGMNPQKFGFRGDADCYYIQKNKFIYEILEDEDFEELTTEQFTELFDKKPIKVFSNGEEIGTVKDLNGSILEPKKETELEKWLRETKAKNLNENDLQLFIVNGKITPVHIYNNLKGVYAADKAKILYDQWNTQEPTEWKPKRGERVLVWDFKGQEPKERIFLSEDGHIDFPILAVRISEKHKFKEEIFGYKHMKPIPKEEPKPIEKDFKSKVIELIEKRNDEVFGSIVEMTAKQNEVKYLLKQIKELN